MTQTAKVQEVVYDLNNMILNKKNREELGFMLKTEADYEKFFIGFYDEFNQGDSIQDFHSYKLQNNTLSKEAFVKSYLGNPIQALEELFIKQMTPQDVRHVKRYIENGKTLEDLYDAHKKDLTLSLNKIY